MTPHVTFSKSIALDIGMTRNFLGHSMGGIPFEESIFEPNPNLRKIDINDDKELAKYFRKEYKNLKPILDKTIIRFQDSWYKVEDHFIKQTMQLFHNHEFPTGKYKAYISITNCNPRFLDHKTFQIFYLKDKPNRTISHELMHFMFYDYSLKKFPEIFANQDPNSGAYWALAELFNNVQLSFSDYRDFLNNDGDYPYPENEKYYQYLVDLWNADRDVDKFIPNAYKYLQNAQIRQ